MFKQFFIAAALSLALCGGQAFATDINIIPTPQSLTVGEGSFTLSAATPLVAQGEGAEQVARFFANKVDTATGWNLAVSAKPVKKSAISFVINPKVAGAEAYSLQVTPTGILASASTADGLFYAAQTLLQLLPPEVEKAGGASQVAAWSVPVVTVNDAPRFEYRGVMLDPCRHFLPVEAVKRQIEILSSYKINRLHWHLTEDQGWRIEIKKYPELLQYGAQRVEGDGSIHKGYYTQEEVKEVVEYARQHHMEVVPELEVPGHELAAIAAYPDLSCREEKTTPRIIWGVEDIVMCPGKENMFKFLEGVIDEMVELFPYKLFHIGGDESPRGEWAKCPNCQKRMKELGYTKEAQLQSYVVGRVEKYLRSKGKTIIGWDEILEGGNLDTTAIVMSWRGEEGGITAAKANHHVLMTPSSHGFYFDHYQGDPQTEPMAIGGYSTLEKVYSYDPVPNELKGSGKEHLVMGVQANHWSEYIHNPGVLELRAYPRVLALSEVAWSPLDKKDFKDFQRRVDGDAALRLAAHGINFHIPVPEQSGGSCDNVVFTDQLDLQLKTTRPLTIVYTTDGSEPSAHAQLYTKPIRITKDQTIKTAAILACGIQGPTRTINARKMALKPAVDYRPLCCPKKCEAKETPAKKGKKKAAAAEPAAKPTPQPGLNLRVAWGDWRSADIPCEAFKADSVLKNFEGIRGLTEVPASVRNVKNYAAYADGYVEIPADGVYEFSTSNHQLWIDNELVVDNSKMFIPRNSPNSAQIALKAGLHRVRVLFIGGIFAGWPTYWDGGSVSYRTNGGKWTNIKGDQLFH